MLTKAEYLEVLKGVEIWSVDWAECVSVVNGKIIAAGKTLCSRPTRKQLDGLFDELMIQEGIR